MKKHKGKMKRWLSGILSTVLVIGSINIVSALERDGDDTIYDAPELTIMQGAETYDLTEGITYDSSLYELAIVNEGGFDVNVPGDYEVTYSLTSLGGNPDSEEPGENPVDSENGEVKDPEESVNSADTDGQKDENESSESGAALDSDTTGSDDSADSSDSSNAGDSADSSDSSNAGDSADSSDSSNAGDSADSSDSSNAGDSADSSDSSNVGDNTDVVQEDSSNSDAGVGESVTQSEENPDEIAVLGVSRSREDVEAADYQAKPVNVEMPEGESVDAQAEDEDKESTQEKQIITFTRWVHVKSLDEDTKEYEAPELVLIQGQTEYDLTEGITYDETKYTLKVEELGGFDINVAGTYDVTYSLTPVEPVTTEETQKNQVITFQRAVLVKAAEEETEVYEVPELVLMQGQEEYYLAEGLIYDANKYTLEVNDLGDFDINITGEYKVTFVLNSAEENLDSVENADELDDSDSDPTEDIFVIPEGITTFARKVIVTPGLALYSSTLDDLTTWPDESLLTEDYIEINFRAGMPIKPGKTINVRSGQTIVVSNGLLTGGENTLFNVQNGGHLVLNNNTITGNKVDDQGAVCVQSGALLDLGYNDKNPAIAPQISGNTNGSDARNLVIAQDARVRLNTEPLQSIGVSYGETLNAPVSIISGGRYLLQKSDINTGKIQPDSTENELVVYNDQIVLRYVNKQILFWYPTRTFNRNDSGGAMTGWVTLAAQQQMDDVWKQLPNTSLTFRDTSTPLVYKGLDDLSLEDMLKFDIIEICAPRTKLAESDRTKLLEYLNKGGRIYIQTESGGWANLNNGVSQVALQLGGAFTMRQDRGHKTDYTTINTQNSLMKGVSSWKLSLAGVIDTTGATGVQILISAPSYKIEQIGQGPGNVKYSSSEPLAVDQYAGDDGNGNKYGRLTIMSDIDAWVSKSGGPAVNSMKVFAGNMLDDSRNNRLKVATGENPNASVPDKQAQIGTMPYLTPAEALAKAKDNEMVELLKSSGLTAASNELLYNTSSIREMNGNTVHADENGTTIDVSDTGAITLHSGMVTVSNAGGERKITVDGYALSSTVNDYTVTAVDGNNNTTLGDSRASVILKNIGDTFTAVKNGATYTYTAKEDNQVFYIGEYSAILNWDERNEVATLAAIGSPEYPAELVKPLIQPNNPYHRLSSYAVTIKPRENYSIDLDKVWVSMGDAQGTQQMLKASEFEKTQDPDTGIITVTVKKAVEGDLIYYVGKVKGGSSSGSTVSHDMTTIQVTSAAGSAVTTPEFTATYFDEQQSKNVTISSQNGKVEVFKNVEVTLKFPAMNAKDPNPTEGALGIAENETFDILKKLVQKASCII